MAEIKVYYDSVGETLTVWFGDPGQAGVCEEAGDDVVLMKDSSGAVIGFEKLNFTPTEQGKPTIKVETGVS
ncbi:MAG: DUF2283 domain-containing protein [Chloroflexi bacterium]|nr:DUF2283 domain-containing protein [Chloroflexota bacterium]MCZ7576179.1 DUF2283 domain-containing protein [Dehalococcoidia bacterium]NJD66119.1 DUF2283 domain-containing protein [Chloroflexota bacterium]PWB45664.1 MAG: DUF2283 domain-containing protein [Dehalococcoidia bacterium]